MVPQHLPSFHCVGVLEPKEPTCTLVFKALLTEQIIGQERKGHAKKKKKDRETCTEDSIEGERLIQQQAVGPHENRHCRRKEKKRKRQSMIREG